MQDLVCPILFSVSLDVEIGLAKKPEKMISKALPFSLVGGCSEKLVRRDYCIQSLIRWTNWELGQW